MLTQRQLVVCCGRRDRERATTRDVRCGGEGNPGPSESYEGDG